MIGSLVRHLKHLKQSEQVTEVGTSTLASEEADKREEDTENTNDESKSSSTLASSAQRDVSIPTLDSCGQSDNSTLAEVPAFSADSHPQVAHHSHPPQLDPLH